MRKPIKDMTAAEKQERIMHLSHKFYDVNERASGLLYTEIDGTVPDNCILDWIKNIEVLEARHHVLMAEYNTIVESELRKIKGALAYEYKILAQEYQKAITTQPLGRFHQINQTTERKRYQTKIEQIKKHYNERKNAFEASARGDLDDCDTKIRNAFMAAVKHLYR